MELPDSRQKYIHPAIPQSPKEGGCGIACQCSAKKGNSSSPTSHCQALAIERVDVKQAKSGLGAHI